MELAVVLVVVAVVVAVVSLRLRRSLAARRDDKAATLRALYGERVTANVAARISIGRIRQVFVLRMRVGEVVERHGQRRVLVDEAESVEVGRVFLGQEELLAADGLALDDIYSVETDDGQRYSW